MTTTAGRIVKHSTIYAIGTLSRQLVGFLMLPVYTNYLTPADYGAVGLLAFTLALMEPLLGARLGEAIPKFYFEQTTDKGRAAVFSAAVVITGAISIFVALTIFVFRARGSTLLFGNDNFSLAVGLFGIQIVTQALEYYGLTYIRMQQKPVLYISINLAKLVLQLSLNIWMIVFLKMGVMGVIISGLFCSALLAAGLTIYTINSVGFAFDFPLAKRMLAFNIPLWFSGLAALYIFSANRYYIRIFSSLDQIGLYELASRFSGVLSLLVWSSFSQFWEMERFNYYKKEHSNPAFGDVFRFVSTLLVVVALGISIFADPAIRIMSAPQFQAAAAAVPLLTLATFFSCLSNFASFSLLVTEQTRIINRNSYITVFIISVLNLLLIPRFGQIGAATALMLSLGAQFLIIHAQAKKYYDMHIKLRPLAIMICVAGAGFIAARYFAMPNNLPIDVAIRAVIYAICSAVLVGMVLSEASTRAQVFKLISPVLLKLRIKPLQR